MGMPRYISATRVITRKALKTNKAHLSPFSKHPLFNTFDYLKNTIF